MAHSIQKRRRKFTPCAVVTNSGILGAIRTLLGELIDLHPAVLRMNGAIAGGAYAEFVGSKTSIRTGYANKAVFSAAKAEYLWLSVYNEEQINLADSMAHGNFTGRISILPESFRDSVKKCVGQEGSGHTSTGMNALHSPCIYGKSCRIWQSSLFSAALDEFNTLS